MTACMLFSNPYNLAIFLHLQEDDDATQIGDDLDEWMQVHAVLTEIS